MSYKSLVGRVLDLARRAALLEGLQPPDPTVIIVDKLNPSYNVVSEGLAIEESSDTVIVEKSTVDNMVYRVLAGVFYLAIWNTYMAKTPEKAFELARKYLFTVLVRLTREEK
ncbi:MAG: hypothetical protein ABWK01_00650 [Infirmifilum sp.]